jgi:hypothetical protein
MSITCLRVERIVLHPQHIVMHVRVLCYTLPSCKTEEIFRPFVVHTSAQVRIHSLSSFEQAEMRNKKLKKDVEGHSQSVREESEKMTIMRQTDRRNGAHDLCLKTMTNKIKDSAGVTLEKALVIRVSVPLNFSPTPFIPQTFPSTQPHPAPPQPLPRPPPSPTVL